MRRTLESIRSELRAERAIAARASARGLARVYGDAERRIMALEREEDYAIYAHYVTERASARKETR